MEVGCKRFLGWHLSDELGHGVEDDAERQMGVKKRLGMAIGKDLDVEN